MANRSYLYSSNTVPSDSDDKPQLRGISEWGYNIPLAYRLLLSGEPRRCRSSIWDVPEPVALAGDYAEGVQALMAFLERTELPSLTKYKDEALAFLSDPANARSYFVLEAGEIFDMVGDDMDRQCEQLLNEVRQADTLAEKALQKLASLAKPKLQGFLAKLFGVKSQDPQQMLTAYIEDLGLGFWENVLYFSFNSDDV